MGESGRETACAEPLLTGWEAGLSEVLTGFRLMVVESVAVLVVEEDLVDVTRVMSRRDGRDDSRKRYPLHGQQC